MLGNFSLARILNTSWQRMNMYNLKEIAMVAVSMRKDRYLTVTNASTGQTLVHQVELMFTLYLLSN